jgi:hypothetical protein
MSIFFVSAALSAVCAIGAPKLNDNDVTNAIAKIVDKLDEEYHKERCWDSSSPSNGWLSKHRGGTTALTTLAMLSAGKSSNSPKIQRAIDYIWEIEEPSSYLLTLRTSIWAQLPDSYNTRLEKDTKRLIKTMSLEYGGWGIDSTLPNSFSETSPLTREFGIIALLAANRRGERIPKKCWTSLANATLASQHKNGGWSYSHKANSGETTANMTVAGLNCLLGVDEVLGGELKQSDEFLLQSAINRGINWLDKHASTSTNSGGTALMSYLYALERAAMSCGLSKVRRRDWFTDGALAIIDAHCGVRKAKGSVVNLSFALLFLTRGHSPIAFCELVVRKAKVDPHRVADIITQRLSITSERNLAWQLVTIDESVLTWLTAPFMLVQNVEAIPDDNTKLKNYLDKGGLLVMLATGKELRQCKEFASTLCPSIEPIENRRDHWSHGLLNAAKNIRLTIWNDGIRDRIIVVQGNGKKVVQSKNSKLALFFTNLCLGAAELNCWSTRLHVQPPIPSKKHIVVAQHKGNWDTELAAFERWKTKAMPLNAVKRNPCILLGGVYESEIDQQLIDDIIITASKGATILVESIGGRGHFAASVRERVAKQTGNAVKPDTTLSHINGRRGWSIHNREALPIPLQTTIGKGSVIFIDCDLRNALLDHTAWGIHGYSHDAAQELLKLVLAK